jgi:hypothetical protein
LGGADAACSALQSVRGILYVFATDAANPSLIARISDRYRLESTQKAFYER